MLLYYSDKTASDFLWLIYTIKLEHDVPNRFVRI